MSESDMEIDRYERQREEQYQEWCRLNLADPEDPDSARRYEEWYSGEAYNSQVEDEERIVEADEDFYGHG